MSNTGYKIFDNRRRWTLDIGNTYSNSIYTTTSYLNGTQSFQFQVYIERDCQISIYVVDDTLYPTGLLAYSTNHIFNNSVELYPFTINTNLLGIPSGNYKFKFTIADTINTFVVGADTDYTENNLISGGIGPYFAPVYDLLSCAIGLTSTTTTTTTTSTTTTTTTAAPNCVVSGNVYFTGYITTSTTTTTTTAAPPPTTTTTTTTSTTTSTTTMPTLFSFGSSAVSTIDDPCIGTDIYYSDCSSIAPGCTIYLDPLGINSLTGYSYIYIDLTNWYISSIGVITAYSANQC